MPKGTHKGIPIFDFKSLVMVQSCLHLYFNGIILNDIFHIFPSCLYSYLIGFDLDFLSELIQDI